MTYHNSKYEDFNTKFVDSLLHLTVKNSYLPKEMTLKEGVMYCPGKVQNNFVTNLLGFIVWMYICGGIAKKEEWAKKSSFINTKVIANYYAILQYLITNNLGITKKLKSLSKVAQSRLASIIV